MLIRRGWFFSIFLCAAITAQRSKMSSAGLNCASANVSQLRGAVHSVTCFTSSPVLLLSRNQSSGTISAGFKGLCSGPFAPRWITSIDAVPHLRGSGCR
jgi:hypothetical protein